MNKDHIAQKIANKRGITKKEALDNINDFLEVVESALLKDEKISLVNFGSFSVKQRKERVGRNPQTGEQIKIEAQKNVSFKPGKKLRDTIKKS